jgi:hypothetical protein
MRSTLNAPTRYPAPAAEPLGNGAGAALGATASVEAGSADPAPGRGLRGERVGWLASHPAWPISAILIGYPIWWALGVADFIWIIMAIPMLSRMAAWRRYGRRVRAPGGFALWMLFIVCVLVGAFALTLVAPGTVPSPVSHRILSFGNRTLTYLGVTVVLLYACNLTEHELPRRKLAYMLGVMAIYTTIGGLAGMAASHFSFKSPFLLLLPHSVQANPFIQASMHPGLAQIQNVIGSAKGRPKAPFDYTDMWGEVLVSTVPFLLAAWWLGGTRRQRRIAAATTVIALAPLLYSLDRGAWIGAAIAVLYLAARLAARGKLAMIGALLAGLVLAAFLLLATPVHTIITDRIHNGESNSIRSDLTQLSIRDALASPVVGYGDTRQQRGSPSSIAIGPSLACPACGQQAVGSNGQLWLLLVCNGFVGTAFYLGFFAYGIWRFRRDRSAYGLAGVLMLILSFLFMFTYTAIPAPLGLSMLVYALLWKNDQAAESSAALGIADPDVAGRQNDRLTSRHELPVPRVTPA